MNNHIHTDYELYQAKDKTYLYNGFIVLENNSHGMVFQLKQN